MKQLLTLTICMLVSSLAVADPIEIEAVPRGVDDGDTYVMHFRSQGVDTPEKAQQCERADGTCYACGQDAKQALLDMITYEENGREERHKLTFKIWTVGTYGRPIVTAYHGDKDLHLELIRQGWAVAYRQYLPASLKDSYIAAETEAKAAKRGIWQGNFIEPQKWRPRGGGLRLPCEE